ncbi:MAG: DUF2278 family protein [Allorhizobium sp.]
MPIANYAVLKGRPINIRLASGASPHYQVLVSANGTLHRTGINVRSQDGSEVAFLVRSRFEHPITDALLKLADGLHPTESRPGGVALDYIRANLMQPWELKPLPLTASGPDNDLNEKIDAYVQRAMADEAATLYAFGGSWGPENDRADQYFGFLPGRGIHGIHLNQGNPPGAYAEQNGPWQDGAVILHFPAQQQWVAIFLKFQSQAWHSNDPDGSMIANADPDHSSPPVDRDRIPSLDVPDGLVRIIAAYVNDVRSPERETVTLLNTADGGIDLSNWQIKDKHKNAMTLTGRIGAGGTLVVEIAAPVELSNEGGIITLLNAEGIKVHGVSYTKQQARQPGRTIPFQP